MTEWQYEMTAGALPPDEVLPQPGAADRSGIFDDIVSGQRKQLKGDGWELLSHSVTRFNSNIVLTLVWRRPAD